MASHDNPWSDETSRSPQGNRNPNPYSTYQDQTSSHNPYAQDQSQTGGYAPPSGPPPHQQPLSSHPPAQQRYYGSTDEAGWGGDSQPYQPPPQSQSQSNPHYPQDSSSYPSNPYSQQQAPSQPHPSAALHSPGSEVPPGLPPRRTATDLAMPTGQDRSHQIEVMQSYEAAGRRDEHDANVETLQREFPKIDGSLIAAIYGDSQSLSATREMLGEL